MGDHDVGPATHAPRGGGTEVAQIARHLGLDLSLLLPIDPVEVGDIDEDRADALAYQLRKERVDDDLVDWAPRPGGRGHRTRHRGCAGGRALHGTIAGTGAVGRAGREHQEEQGEQGQERPLHGSLLSCSGCRCGVLAGYLLCRQSTNANILS